MGTVSMKQKGERKITETQYCWPKHQGLALKTIEKGDIFSRNVGVYG